ncbi:MAG: MFS transporter [Acidimicrobiia bacterium]|nr:MFS transporter [Acidimicrobiia bacterium]MDH5520188.1 MFS transporter [Acidimicrobiia bacterium]
MTNAVERRSARSADWHGWLPVWSLGLYTITAYGTWAYAFGVLIEPISTETGWSTSFLGSVYGVAMLLTGLSAFGSGRLLDRFGPMVPLGLHAVVASGLMLAAVSVERRWLFGLLFASGAGLSGATGFYAMTTVIAARSRPDRPERAIAVLTLIGAFCSPIYLPLTAWLLTVWDWRTVARALVLAGVVGAAQAAAITARVRLAPEDEMGGPVRPSARSLDAVKRAVVKPEVRRALIVYFLAGAAAGSMWVYQVPMMVGAGLGIGLAGTLAGFRGFCQIFGRMGLTGAVERHGSARLLQAAYLATAAGGIALLIASIAGADSTALVVVLSLVFALFAGTGFGASSPLQAIHARLHFDPGDLGLLMGLQGAVLGLAGAAGPIAGAFLRDATGTWTPTIAVVIVILVISTALLRPARRRPSPIQNLQLRRD